MIRTKNSDGKWNYLLPVYSSNRKPKPLYAVVNGTPTYCPTGTYFLRYTEDQKPKLEPVGNDVTVAITEQIKRGRMLAAKASGIEVVNDAEKEKLTENRHPLQPSIAAYLEHIKDNKMRRTDLAYSLHVTRFGEYSKKLTIEAIEQEDILAFARWLKKEHHLSPRTVFNHVDTIKHFLLYYDCPWPVDKHNMPKYTERTPTAYDTPEILQLVVKADQDERDLVAFLAHTNVREREAAFACWTDIDNGKLAFSVQEKPDFPEFVVKGRHERSIPIPPEFAQMMNARHKRYSDSRLIFPSVSGKPEGHLIRRIKELALRSELNCGHCWTKPDENGESVCCKEYPVCGKWILHDFRRTFATTSLANGATILEIHDWLGHEDIATTMLYLKSAEVVSDKGRAAINSSFRGLATTI